MTNDQFIEKIGNASVKCYDQYKILPSLTIAQAILESNWGKSSLASKYYNFFGMKCGTSWKGKSVRLKTKEEYTKGKITEIYDNFRVYGSFDDGIKGRMEFLQMKRYQNLKGITDIKKAVKTIVDDGYCTDKSYVDKIMNLVKKYNLTKYDEKTLGEKAQNSSKTFVKALQKALNTIDIEDLPKLVEDGLFGKNTKLYLEKVLDKCNIEL